jgi:glycosyltransferase involved in cell wall biosynthesis
MRVAMMSTCALSTPPKKYGGTELVVSELAKGLLSLGHDVTVYATGDSGVFGKLKYYYEGPTWPPNDQAESRHAAFAWHDITRDAGKYDIVHVHHGAALPPPRTLQQPVVATVHHARVDSIVQHYLASADVSYVAISDRQAELCPELPWARTIHHGLDPSLYPAGTGSEGYVAFLGRFAPEKAPHIAIDAARDAGCRIVLGGVPHEQLPEARAYFEHEMQPRLRDTAMIDWPGELSHGPKVRLLAGARALLFPINWEEPFGLVMIESMLIGTPVIAFARGSAPEVIEDGVTGYLVHSREEMAERIRQIGQIDRARCRARAQERWSFTRMARDYVELYQQLLERKRRHARRELHASRASLTPVIATARVAKGTAHGAQRG